MQGATVPAGRIDSWSNERKGEKMDTRCQPCPEGGADSTCRSSRAKKGCPKTGATTKKLVQTWVTRGRRAGKEKTTKKTPSRGRRKAKEAERFLLGRCWCPAPATKEGLYVKTHNKHGRGTWKKMGWKGIQGGRRPV